MKLYIETLGVAFENQSNHRIATEQKAYMKHQFEFYGLKSPVRRTIQKPFLIKQYLPQKAHIGTMVKELWTKPQREFHYFAQELAFKYTQDLEQGDIELYEYMVTHQSWWDTVDFISVKLMGAYFMTYPELQRSYVEKWLLSNHMWLQRSALLFQLKYKEDIDPELLGYTITSLVGSKEFFINKAIGWILREYSKTNPTWVAFFVDQTTLSNLSKREALRLMK